MDTGIERSNKPAKKQKTEEKFDKSKYSTSSLESQWCTLKWDLQNGYGNAKKWEMFKTLSEKLNKPIKLSPLHRQI